MRIFRKISFLFVSFALVMLAAHGLLPHHHGQGESVEMCCNHNHSTSDAFAAREGSHNHGEICGISHNFTHNQEDIVLIAPYIVLEQFLVLPTVQQVEEAGYDVGDAPLLKLFFARSKLLRAPPVVFC